MDEVSILSSAPKAITGTLMLGYLLSWGLFGVLTVQVYLYYTAFPGDQKKFKVLVYLIYSLDAMQTIMLTHDAFQRFVYGYGDLQALGRVNLLWFSLPLLDGLGKCSLLRWLTDSALTRTTNAVAYLVQLQYAYRIHLLSPKSKKSTGVLVMIMITSLAQFGGAISGAITCFAFEQLGDASSDSGVLTSVRLEFSYVWLVGSVIADVTIALSMIFVLSRYDRKPNPFRTHSVIRRIIRLTVETGSVTAILAICLLALFVTTISHDAYYFAPGATLAKVYSNSFMVIVNSRIQMARRDDGQVNTTNGLVLNDLQTPRRTEIRAQIETNVWRDPIPKDGACGLPIVLTDD
ncbi:hypothetical protein VNI00_002919 [Paramarasmius palmivorus]|uniref:DUF6534 domain-containing protein n=1 Tax=Paramarasmius palmivorus TaxID=297713 RepID=A0AAW0DXX2_9AGAR